MTSRRKCLVALAALWVAHQLAAYLLTGAKLSAALLSPGSHAISAGVTLLIFVLLRVVVLVAFPPLLVVLAVTWRAPQAAANEACPTDD